MRDFRFGLVFTAEEKQALDRLAHQQGVSAATVLRLLLKEASEKQNPFAESGVVPNKPAGKIERMSVEDFDVIKKHHGSSVLLVVFTDSERTRIIEFELSRSQIMWFERNYPRANRLLAREDWRHHAIGSTTTTTHLRTVRGRRH